MYHILLSRDFDLEGIEREAQAGKRPRHVIWNLSQTLGATVHVPTNDPLTLFDWLCSKIIGQPEQWALARRLVSQLTEHDTVFCLGEDVGFALAILCKFKGKRPKLAVSVMAPYRRRVRRLLKFFRLSDQIDLFAVNTQIKATYIRDYLQLSGDRIYQQPEQTDIRFFNPGAAQPKTRPLVVSAGLEQRDYQTLATATQALDVDVKICAVSPNASAKTKVVFPKVMPDNMASRHYDWSEFLQLYRDADVVVVSLLWNNYSAGLTTLIEAMACRRPVVMTRTPGLADELINLGLVTGVEAGDAAGLQHAITHLLEHPEVAAQQAEAAYARILSEHTSEYYVESMIAQLQQLGNVPQPESFAAPLPA
ncbi:MULTISPECIES: glycosyltransferase [Cyanophyceae]|uniref:Glycosyltransferase n=1 Tax=Stenomitos frigidus AS-A4 TaxID=2933935 RepID=A0ABV0KH92_9CYAN|nr:glycosyltransferase [Phormidium sp. FACHB-592]